MMETIEPIKLYQCPHCEGHGWTPGYEEDHHPDCDGECVVCPIQIDTQDACEVCKSEGQVEKEIAREFIIAAHDNLRAVEIIREMGLDG